MCPVPSFSPAQPVGVFDSGVGGLTVLHELLVHLPHEDFLYLGDTARFPYGERSREELEGFALQIGELLLERGAKLLVVACNAATASGLPALRARMAELAPGLAVVGVVSPPARVAAAATRSGRIGLLATPVTVASGAYESAVRELAPSAEVVSVACPDLAPIIEGGFPFDQRVVDTVRSYCEPLRAAEVDTVILGCTHYPLVAPMLQRALGPGVTLVTSGAAAAADVQGVLGERSLSNHQQREGDYRFLCTGEIESFRTLGTRFLQMPLTDVSAVTLDAKVPA
jgi:glutamate racemase